MGVQEEKKNEEISEEIDMKKNKKENTTTFKNRFTGEELSTYPTPFAKMSQMSKKTKDQDKLKSQIEKFNKRYVCKFCGEPREWIPGTNVMVCKNPECKGHVVKIKNKDGNEIEISEPSLKILTTRGTAIAETLLS